VRGFKAKKLSGIKVLDSIWLFDVRAGENISYKIAFFKKEKQMKQRGSAPHLPIHGYRPHPSNRLKHEP
jgi:hypothetical protein